MNAPAARIAAEVVVMADGAATLAWTYRVPVINNRYAWIRWAWMAAASAAFFAGVIGTLVVAMFPGGLGFAVKLYAAIGLVSAAAVLGLGLFAAAAVGNGVRMRFVLAPDRAVATDSGTADDIEGATEWLPGMSLETAEQTADAAALMLPSGGQVRWSDVRAVRFDEARGVITLRRRVRTLRLYAPPGRYADVAAFVRAHVPPGAIASPAAGG